jgi:hypothetical protein
MKVRRRNSERFSIAIVACMVLLSFMPVYSQTGNDLNFEFVKQVQARHEDKLFQLGEVYAVGIGKEGKRFVIDVYGERAVELNIPAEIDGVSIRFNESGPFYASSVTVDGNHRATFSPPIPIGVSTGNTSSNVTATIGFKGSVPPILSAAPGPLELFGYITANHVAAGPCWNQKPIGEDQFQAGKVDNPIGDKIGDLHSFVPVVRGLSSTNEVDAAFVKTITSSTIGDQICDLSTRTTTPVQPGLNMIVKKSGRTTEVTEGRIISVSATVTVTLIGCGTTRFINQIMVKPTSNSCPEFSDQGDSGAPVVDLGNNPVGIVISDNDPIFGCNTARTTVTPIQSIMNALSFTLR